MFKFNLNYRLSVALLVLAIILNARELNAQNQQSTLTPQTQSQKSLSTKSSYNSAYQFIGNSFSRKYHKADCEFAKKINPAHVVFFTNSAQADNSGSKPCNWCLPVWSKDVHGSVLKKPESRIVPDKKESQPLSSLKQSTRVIRTHPD